MLPIKIDTEIAIEGSIDRVWAVLTDYAAYADWNPYLVAVEGAAHAGAVLTVHSVLRPGMAPSSQPVTVVSVAPYTMRWEGGLSDKRLFHGDHWFVLSGDDTRTQLSHYEYFSGSKAAALIDQYGAQITENFRIFNAALKARSEH